MSESGAGTGQELAAVDSKAFLQLDAAAGSTAVTVGGAVASPATACLPSPSHASAHTKVYRADVDGLRALAVLPVLLFHGGFSYLSGGYVGVDIFFVISGFVIASKLVEDLDAGHYSIAAFYARRIRRIIPALTATILVCYFAAMFLFLPDAMRDFSRSVMATALFVSNIYFWKSSGYFETAALDRPLLHTWSLAIEEQFYLFIPIALYFAYRYSRRYAWLPFLLLALFSLALSVFITDMGPTANFFLLPTRAWELLLGVLLVLLPLKGVRGKFANEALALVGLAFIGYAIATFTDATPFPGLSALLPTVGAAILIHVGRHRLTLVGRALSSGPLVGIGLISYSLYLVHWPIIVFARYALLRNLEGSEILLMVAVSIGLAYLSWLFVETPLRRPRTKHRDATPLPIFAVTASVLLGTIALGGIGVSTRGFAARFPDYRAQEASAIAEDTWLTDRCFLENQDALAWAGDNCIRTRGAQRNAILWGDSFAAHYIPGLMKNAGALTHNIVQYTFAGCPPILSYASYARPGCHGFNANIFSVIHKYRVDTVVMSARWDELRQRGLSGLKETIARLKAEGISVYVLGQSPMFGFDVAVLDYRGAGARADKTSSWAIAFDSAENERLRSQSGSAIFIDPLSSFCREGVCTYRSGQGLLFSDYGHFSSLGSDDAVRAYFPLYRSTQSTASAGR